MNSKTLNYLSYSMIFLALILTAIFNFLFHIKISMLFFMLPAVLISYFLKLSALKKAITKNKDLDFIEVIEKEINNAKWAGIAVLGLGIVEVIYRYS